MGMVKEAKRESDWLEPATRSEAYHEAVPLEVAQFFRAAPLIPPIPDYEELRANFLTRYPLGTVKTVLFAGAARGDGVTTIANQFASGVARGMNLRTVLIDLDFRSAGSNDHVTSSLSDTTTSDLLSSLSDKVLRSIGSRDSYRLLTTGKLHSAPFDLFQSPQFERFLTILGNQVDLLILDAPPVLEAPETLFLTTKVDGAVLVARSGRTRLTEAKRVKEQIEELGGRLLGIVINREKRYIPNWLYRYL